MSQKKSVTYKKSCLVRFLHFATFEGLFHIIMGIEEFILIFCPATAITFWYLW